MKKNFFSRILGVCFLIVVIFITNKLITLADPFTPWYNTLWTYRKPITIDHTKVSGGSDLTNFPMLVSVVDPDLRTIPFGGKAASGSGEFVFTLSDGITPLSYETEKYDASTGELISWIKVPTLSATLNTVLYIYYGNPSGGATNQNKTGVWDSNYKGVWHLNETVTDESTVTAAHKDSTSNANNGTQTNNDDATAKIGVGQSLDGTLDYLNLGNPASLNTLQDISFSMWIKPSVLGVQKALMGKDDTSWPGGVDGSRMSIDTSNRILLLRIFSNGGAFHRTSPGYITTTDAWYHVVGTATNSGSSADIHIYVNGVETTYDAGPSATPPLINDAVTSFTLGARDEGDQAFNGILDEIRVSNAVRSSGWIQTEYNSQNSPGTFYAVGMEETAPAPTPTPTLTPTPSPTPTPTPTPTLTPTPTPISYRKPITIDHTKVSGGSDLTNFPMLVSVVDPDLRTIPFGGKAASGSGEFVFTSSDGITPLNYEIEKYVPATGELISWVKMPLLSATLDTVLYLYYGNPSTGGSNQNPVGVWDINYAGVWHLKETVIDESIISNIYKDSTSNINHGTQIRSDDGVGKIGLGQNLDGTLDYVNLGNPTSLNTLQNFSFSLWMKPGVLGTQRALMGKDATSWPGGTDGSRMSLDTSNRILLVRSFSDGGAFHRSSPGYITTTGTWYHIVGTATNSGSSADIHIYINGVETTYDAGPSATPPVTNDMVTSFTLGARDQGDQAFNGVFDEVRVSKTVRSSGWVATEYSNQSSPATFYTVGTEEIIPPPPPDTTAPAISNITVSNITQTSAEISWTTNEASDSQVEFLGPCPLNGCTTPLATQLVTNHLVNVSTLVASTSYPYMVKSRDAAGNLGTSGVSYLVTGIPTPPPQSVSFFDHFSDPNLNSRWSPLAAGVGNFKLVDGTIECSSPQPNDGCAIYKNVPIDKTKSQLWTFAISNHSGAFPQWWVTLADSATVPTSSTLSSWNPKLRARISAIQPGTTKGLAFEYWTANHTLQQWDSTTNNWTVQNVLANSPIKSDDYYLVSIEVDGPGNRWRMLGWTRRSADTSYTYDQGLQLFAMTNWVSWNNLETTDNLWLILGEPVTDSLSGDLRVEWARLDAGTKQHAWTNGRNNGGVPYAINHEWGYEGANGGVEIFVPEDRTANTIGSGPVGAWDYTTAGTLGIKDPYTLYDPTDSTYYLLYQAHLQGIGLATSQSPNGPFTKFSGNPIISSVPGSNENMVMGPAVIKDTAESDPQKRFKLFYSGYDDTNLRVLLATAPAMVGPWTKQGVIFDVGPAGAFDQNGPSWARPVFTNGQWYVFVNGFNKSEFGGPYRVTYYSGPTLNTLTRSGIILVDKGVGPVRDVTANIAGRIVSVTNTSGFIPDAYVEIDQDGNQDNYSQSRIRKVINGTTLELYHGLDGFTTATPAKISQIDAANRMTIADIQQVGNRWWMYVTAFNLFGAYYPTYYAFDENLGLLTSDNIDGPYVWSHLASPPMSKTTWNTKRSNENITLIHYPN